jgi:transcriptional regulator with XRE-family HTH domain
MNTDPVPPVNRRIKQVREALRLSQVQFSRVLSLSSGYLAGVELGKRKANDRIIKLICSSFKTNGQWLRTGEGAMFDQEPSLLRLVSLYRELEPRFQQYILKQIDLLLEIQDKESGG